VVKLFLTYKTTFLILHTAKRKFLSIQSLQSIAAYGLMKEGRLSLEEFLSAPDGFDDVRDKVRGEPDQYEAMGRTLADLILEAGGGRMPDLKRR